MTSGLFKRGQTHFTCSLAHFHNLRKTPVWSLGTFHLEVLGQVTQEIWLSLRLEVRFRDWSTCMCYSEVLTSSVLTRYLPHEMNGSTIYQHIYCDDIPEVKVLHEQALRTPQEMSLERVRMKLKDGRFEAFNIKWKQVNQFQTKFRAKVFHNRKLAWLFPQKLFAKSFFNTGVILGVSWNKV